MPRQTNTGKYIFSASEVAEYVVCPEAWYLTRMTEEPVLDSPEQQEGDKLHQSWAEDYAEGLTIARLLRLLIVLGMTATVLMLLRG